MSKPSTKNAPSFIVRASYPRAAATINEFADRTATWYKNRDLDAPDYVKAARAIASKCAEWTASRVGPEPNFLFVCDAIGSEVLVGWATGILGFLPEWKDLRVEAESVGREMRRFLEADAAAQPDIAKPAKAAPVAAVKEKREPKRRITVSLLVEGDEAGVNAVVDPNDEDAFAEAQDLVPQMIRHAMAGAYLRPGSSSAQAAKFEMRCVVSRLRALRVLDGEPDARDRNDYVPTLKS